MREGLKKTGEKAKKVPGKTKDVGKQARGKIKDMVKAKGDKRAIAAMNKTEGYAGRVLSKWKGIRAESERTRPERQRKRKEVFEKTRTAIKTGPEKARREFQDLKKNKNLQDKVRQALKKAKNKVKPSD
jgi:hypothetical protein